MPQTTLTLSLELSPHLHARRTRERSPSARLTLTSATGERDLGALRVDVEKPELGLDDGSVDSIDAQGVLASVIDEAAWMAELARVLVPGGTLRLTLPASGPLAWLDARNTYRYVGDILGRGDNPDSTLPTGWNRHYNERDIAALFDGAGFRDLSITRAGFGLTELPQIAGLMVGNFLLNRRDTEMRLFPLRRTMERIESRIPAPGIGTILTVTATRAHAEPDDPSVDAAPENRPAPEIDSE